jgi:hypothetical protein
MQQTSTEPQPPPAADVAPAHPITITTPGPGGTTQKLTVPTTTGEVEQLISRRDELSSQLSSVTSRRNSLSEQIRSAPDGASRTGLEARIRLLDQRILQLETDIAVVGQQLAAAPADLVSFTERRPQNGGGDNFEDGVAAGSIPLLMLITVVWAYRRYRRRKMPKVPAAQANLLTDSAQRLERVENAVDAIALEIERVGEGQRFVTKLLSESPERQPVNRGTA